LEAAISDEVIVRRTWRDADARAIVGVHRRVYVPEFGMNEEFLSRVGLGIQRAVAAGWPQRSGAVWLPERGGQVHGSLALTDEGDGTGRVRWFVLDASVRGRRLGAELIAELLDTAREVGMERLVLDTFSALTVAARLYKGVGFRLLWERERTDWGPPILYQGYELELR